MKSALVIITATAYVAGSVGLPIVAYSCPMTGKTGVTVEFDSSLPVCFVEPCCESKPHRATVRSKAGDSCCDFTVQGGVEYGQTALTGFKYGAEHRVRAGRLHFDECPAPIHAVTTTSSPIARAPINLPLLI